MESRRNCASCVDLRLDNIGQPAGAAELTDQQDLQDVRRAEQSRGRRKPTQVLSLEEARELREICRDLLRPEATREDLESAMRALGIEPGTKRYEAVLRAWRAERRS